MNIQTYNDIKIEELTRSEHYSNAMYTACEVTQKKLDLEKLPSSHLPTKLAKYLLDAKHTSIFEHASLTFLASGISRSLLAQVTRQRMFSFTSASQHYQDYRDYPMVLRPGWSKDEHIANMYSNALESSLHRYIALIQQGEKPEEARQILPNACAVNLVITANPRALVDFLTVRLCHRNTEEMQIFARELYKVCNLWLPEIFNHIGPECYTGQCKQGKMKCTTSFKESLGNKKIWDINS